MTEKTSAWKVPLLGWELRGEKTKHFKLQGKEKVEIDESVLDNAKSEIEKTKKDIADFEEAYGIGVETKPKGGREGLMKENWEPAKGKTAGPSFSDKEYRDYAKKHGITALEAKRRVKAEWERRYGK
jgi:hypothetical protein